ncbi:MAG: tetratricopeptide repeat protein [bacterium]|nr:tetratricopeptide repeat protein [bacterium]
MIKNQYKIFIILIIPVIFFHSGCATFKKDTPDSYLTQGKLKLEEKNYLSAISYLQEGEKKDTKNKLKPEILFLIGEAFFQQSIEYHKTIYLFTEEAKTIYFNYLNTSRKYFERVIKEYPKSILAGDAQYNIGVSFDWDEMGGVNDFEKAVTEYQKVIDNYPGSSAYPKAKSRIELIKSIHDNMKDSPHDIENIEKP